MLTAPKPEADAPLLPFEQRTLDHIINQVQALSPRVKAAFFDKISDDPGFFTQ